MPKHTNAVVIRIEPTQTEYDALAARYGIKRATREDFRAWAVGTLTASMEVVIEDMHHNKQRKLEREEEG